MLSTGARMSPGAEHEPIIGISWSTTTFHAYLIASGGSLLEEHAEPSGVLGLERERMSVLVGDVARRWPTARSIYASGMIGSKLGWVEAPYAQAPAGSVELAQCAVPATMGDTRVIIVPGIACRRSSDGWPDVMRGEEIEIIGAAGTAGDAVMVIPGTHTKWVRVRGRQVIEFVTSISGEIFDRLAEQGLLASVTEGSGEDSPAFLAGVAASREQKLGLGVLLFGVRAMVVGGELPRSDAASYIRGLLIGSEISDAAAALGGLGDKLITLVGDGSLIGLYRRALELVATESARVTSQDARITGFLSFHRAMHA